MLYQKMKLEIMRYTWEGGKDLGVADTTVSLGIPIWGGGSGYVVGIHGHVGTAFTGITGPLWVEIGDSTNTDSILPRRNLANIGDLHTSSPWYIATSPSCVYGLTTKHDMTPPIITFTSDSGNLEDLTAGEIEVVVVYLTEDNS